LNASGEVRDPARTIQRAILLSLSFVAVLYIGLQVVAQGVLGPRLAGENAPLVAVAAAAFGGWAARVVVVTTALCVAGFLSSDLLCSPRIFHALAERGQLPARVAAVHPRLKTPAVAIGLYTAMCAVLAISGSFTELALISASGTLVGYLICCLGVLSIRHRHVTSSEAPFIAPGGHVVPLAAGAIIVWTLSTLPAREVAAAASLVVVAGVVYAVQALRQRTRRDAPVTAM
jgi:amino acid transporter